MTCGTTQGCDVQTGLCAECVCAPGTRGTTCADANNEKACSASCLGYEPKACGTEQTCVVDECLDVICTPGAKRCIDAGNAETCNATGTAWENAIACNARDICVGGEGCITRCAAGALTPSTLGCSFFALDMDTYNDNERSAVVLMNPNLTTPDDAMTANVKIYASPGGFETLLVDNITIASGATYTFTMPAGTTINQASLLRRGGSFRVVSDLPLHAIQHSPLKAIAANDASCLIPENALGNEYFVASYTSFLAYPSYLNVVATADANVTVKVPVATAAGTGVPAIAAGGSQTFAMSRYDTLQIIGPNDITGTHITSTAPIAVFGATECSQVPVGTTYCDPLQEQMLPTSALGKTYLLAPHAARSSNDAFRWRVVATEDDTAIASDPAIPSFPATLAKGAFFEFETAASGPNGGSVVLTSNKRFGAFQYMRSQNASGAGTTGDPMMSTVIPTEQFVTRSLLFFPTGYDVKSIQIVRSTSDEVSIDGEPVAAAAFTTVGTYSYANVAVGDGLHLVTSAGPVGISTFATHSITSFGAPAAMGLRSVAP